MRGQELQRRSAKRPLIKIVFKGMAEENELQSLSHGTRTPNLNHRRLQGYNWHSSDLRVSQTDLPCRLVSMRFNAELQLGIFWSLRIVPSSAPSLLGTWYGGLDQALH